MSREEDDEVLHEGEGGKVDKDEVEEGGEEEQGRHLDGESAAARGERVSSPEGVSLLNPARHVKKGGAYLSKTVPNNHLLSTCLCARSLSKVGEAGTM